MTAARRRLIAPLVWVVVAALSVVAALGWSAGPLIVGGVNGELFEIGPLLPGWSLQQTLRPERGPELFVGFEARPTANVESPPTVEVRLEREDRVLWADRLSLTGAGMREYVATFPVPTDGSAYRMAVRVLEAPGGGVVLRGVDIGEPTATTQLTIMGQPLRGFLALGHRMFQRVPPVRHVEAVAAALAGWTLAVAAGVAVVGALVGAAATVLLARVYGRLMAGVTPSSGRGAGAGRRCTSRAGAPRGANRGPERVADRHPRRLALWRRGPPLGVRAGHGGAVTLVSRARPAGGSVTRCVAGPGCGGQSGYVGC